MTLYEIDSAILALADENGEITDFDALDALMMDRERKIENVVCWVKDLNAEAAAIRAEELALAKRRQTAENKEEHLRAYLERALDGAEFSTAKCRVGYRASKQTVLDDQEKLLRWLRRNKKTDAYEVKTVISRSAVGDMIKQGISVPGAHVEEKRNMQIK